MRSIKGIKKKLIKRGRGINSRKVSGIIPKDPRKTGIGGVIIGALLMLLLLNGLGLFNAQSPLYIYGTPFGVPVDDTESVKFYQMIVTIDWIEEELLLADDGAVFAYLPPLMPEDPEYWILVGTQEDYVADEFIEDFLIESEGVGRSMYDFPDDTAFAVLGFDDTDFLSYFEGFVVPGVNTVFSIIIGGWPSGSTVHITWAEDGSGTDWTGQTNEWRW